MRHRIFTCTYICMHAYGCTHMCIHTYICICVYVQEHTARLAPCMMHMHTYILAYLHIHMRVCSTGPVTLALPHPRSMHAYMNTCIHTYIYICACVQVHLVRLVLLGLVEMLVKALRGPALVSILHIHMCACAYVRAFVRTHVCNLVCEFAYMPRILMCLCVYHSELVYRYTYSVRECLYSACTEMY